MILSDSARSVFAPVIASLALAGDAAAGTVVVDYDAIPTGDFRTAPYVEHGVTTTVDAGHYEAYADATGDDGDRALNLDERELGLSRLTVTAEGGAPFDAVSLEVINPADAPGEYTISAVGGGGGSVSVPTAAGLLSFGPQFAGIQALVVTQHAPGSFTFDDLTIRTLPEPPRAASLVAGALALSALRRRRARIA